jgi:hypothetical protein
MEYNPNNRNIHGHRQFPSLTGIFKIEQRHGNVIIYKDQNRNGWWRTINDIHYTKIQENPFTILQFINENVDNIIINN